MKDLVNVDLVKALQLRDLDTAETEMLKYDQAECGVIHRFYPGIYIREVTLPKGTLAIGHYQKKEHLNVFLQGRVSMLKDDGTIEDMEAPMIFMGKPGRKCGYIHEDVVWLNIFPTDETDVEKIESEIIDKSDNWHESNKKKEGLDMLSKITDKVVPLPFGGYKVALSDSEISGKGVFATSAIKKGEVIGPATYQGKKTILHMTNHSDTPNAQLIELDTDVALVAIKDISGCHGGKYTEEITVNRGLSCQS